MEPITTAKVMQAAWGFLGWRGALAFIAIMALLFVTQCQLPALKEQVTAQIGTIDALSEANTKYAKVETERAKEEEARQREAVRIDKENKVALEKAEKAKLQAQANLYNFKRRYKDRDQTCSEALLALDAACPDLKDY